jgi:hypothetical protein
LVYLERWPSWTPPTTGENSKAKKFVQKRKNLGAGQHSGGGSDWNNKNPPQPKEDKNFEREEVKQNRRTTDEESHLRREGGATTIPLRSVCVCLYFC